MKLKVKTPVIGKHGGNIIEKRGQFFAVCSCKWKGGPYEYRSEARSKLWEHNEMDMSGEDEYSE